MEYGVYRTPEGGPDVYRHYVDMYREMRSPSTAPACRASGSGSSGGDTYTHRVLFLPEQMARGIDLDPFVDAYSVHFYSLRFDTLPPSEGSWTSPIGDLMSSPARQVPTAASAGSGCSRPRWGRSTTAGG